MFKKILAVLLSGLLIQLFTAGSVSASTKEEKQAQRIEKVKSGISKLGIGRDARIEVKLRDQTRLAGYISEIKGDSFIITNPKSGTATTVAYSKASGHNLSTGAKIAGMDGRKRIQWIQPRNL
jgi:hypothetical protein